MKTLTLEVSAADIRSAERATYFSGPLCRSIVRTTNGACVARIVEARRNDPPALVIHALTADLRFNLSKPALRFIERFERGETVKPATFRLVSR